jgi:prepilin-type N-terminal cleavage/methylation domain-containing protein
VAKKEEKERNNSILLGDIKMRNNKRGFSLIEIMLVMAIIGLLASILLPAISKARWNAALRKCAGNLRGLGQLLVDLENRSGGYACYYTISGLCNAGDPLPTGSNLWKYLQADQVESTSEAIKSDLRQMQKQVYSLYVCNIKGEIPHQGKVSYRGPKDPLTPSLLSAGGYIGGDDLFDHGREKGKQINVLLTDFTTQTQAFDDPNFQSSYNAMTTK